MSVFLSDAEIEAIALAFLNRTLPKAQWTHAAHFASAIWLIVERPDLDAASVMPACIRAYNESVGTVNSDSSGYHETITQASLRAARFFCSQPESLAERVNRLLESPHGRSGWLLEYWSKDVLFSAEARRTWVEPDIAPLPF